MRTVNLLGRLSIATFGVMLAVCLSACATDPSISSAGREGAAKGEARWAIALHGGAGTIDRDADPALIAQYERSLAAALAEGRDRLNRGESAMDVCVAVVRILEDDPLFNAGRGAAFNERGGHELDASVMDGATMRCGAVAGVRTVKNPVSLARLVMEKTNHVLLAGDGAEEFAGVMGVERVPNSYFDTDARRQILDEVLRERREKEVQTKKEQGRQPHGGGGEKLPHTRGDGRRQPTGTATNVAVSGLSSEARAAARFGTVGCVVLDTHGHLAAATSTGGLTGKRYGRIGDSPIIGAGTYADDTVAVSCTGTGEEFIRHAVASGVSARMVFGGMDVRAAARNLIFRTLRPDDGGLIAVDRFGNIVAEFSTIGMYRGLADSGGRFDVRIFKD